MSVTAIEPAPPPFPLLETPRLRLREIVPADAAALFGIHGDADLMRWFGSDPLQDIADAQRLIGVFAGWRLLANPGVRWGLAAKDSGDLVGSVGLFGWNRGWRKCTLGYELARQAQGRGLMQEALQAAIAWGFEAMALNRIEALIHPDNRASLASARRLGFVEEGRLRQAGHWAGVYHDMLQHGLLRSDWPHRMGAA